MMRTGILFIYMLTSCAEIAWRGGDPIQCGAVLVELRLFRRQQHCINNSVNVKYNYLSIESSCLGWQVCEIKLLE